jgi:uncharacterized phage-like protein YoqJ
MYISFSGSSISSISSALEEYVRDHLSHYENEIFDKLEAHEYGGSYEIDLVIEEISSDMAEEFHGDIEGIVTDHFDNHTHWQSEAREKLEEKLKEADEEAEGDKEDK